MQKIEVLGNVGKDAVIKSVNGKDIMVFNVCVTETYKNQNGERVEKSTWYGCLSSITGLCKYIKKGHQIFVEGELNAKIYVNDKKESSLDLSVSVQRIELLNNKDKESNTQN